MCVCGGMMPHSEPGQMEGTPVGVWCALDFDADVTGSEAQILSAL